MARGLILRFNGQLARLNSHLIPGVVALKEVLEVAIVGVGIASVWFYIRSLVTGDLTPRSFMRWGAIIIPISILMSGGLKALHII